MRAGRTHIAGLVVLFLFSGIVAIALAAQQPSAAPQAPAGPITTLKSESRLVLVDTVVTDKKGNYISDLSEKDFKVWEDDKEQPINSFSLSQSSADLKGQPQYMVVIFDNSNLKNVDLKRERDTAAKFVETYAGPNRYVAIMDFGNTLSLAQNFTTDSAHLQQVVLNDKFSSTQSATDSLQIAARQGLEGSFSVEGDYGARNLLEGIRAVARKMAGIPGRKSMILLSTGFVLGPQDNAELLAATDTCNKANVAIYPVALRGLTSDVSAQSYVAGHYDTSTMGPSHPGMTSEGTDNTSASSLMGHVDLSGRSSQGPATPPPPTSSGMSVDAANAQVLSSLANSTGGFVVVNSNELLPKLERISKEQTEYYILGYTPAPSAEASCHSLRVKVDRPNTVVRSRSVYCAMKSADPLAGKPIEKVLEAHANDASPGNVAATMRAPYFYTSPNVARVSLAIEIPPGAVMLAKEKGKFQGSINILGLAYKPDGTVGARFSDTVPLQVESKKDVDAFNKNPLRYSHQFEVAPGNYDLRVALTFGEDHFAKLQVPLVIAPYDGKQFAISAVALSKDVRPAAADAAEASLFEDRVPLVSHGFEFVPTGSQQFKKGESGAFYVEIYDPRLLDANPPTLAIDLKVIDVKTGTAKVDAGGAVPDVKAGNSKVPLGLKIPMDALPPGKYRLELKASDSSGNASEARTADFQVE